MHCECPVPRGLCKQKWWTFLISPSSDTPCSSVFGPSKHDIRDLALHIAKTDELPADVERHLKNALEIMVLGDRASRLWAVVVVYYILKMTSHSGGRECVCVTYDMIPVGFLLQPGSCAGCEQFCLLRLLSLVLLIFRENVENCTVQASMMRFVSVMKFAEERQLRFVLKDLEKLCSNDARFLSGAFCYNVWEIVGSCFNASYSGEFFREARKLKALGAKFLECLPSNDEGLDKQLRSIQIARVVWMLDRDDLRECYPDIFKMIANELTRVPEHNLIEKAILLAQDANATYQLKKAIFRFLQRLCSLSDCFPLRDDAVSVCYSWAQESMEGEESEEVFLISKPAELLC